MISGVKTSAELAASTLTGAELVRGVQSSANVKMTVDQLLAGVQGTFTPLLRFGGASVGITYTIQLGKYTKIGRVVFINIYITLSAKGSSTGTAAIEGLPYTAAASFNVPVTPIYQNVDLNVAGGYYSPAAYIPQNGAGVLLFEQGDNVAIAQLTEADFSNTSTVILSGFYHV